MIARLNGFYFISFNHVLPSLISRFTLISSLSDLRSALEKAASNCEIIYSCLSSTRWLAVIGGTRQ